MNDLVLGSLLGMSRSGRKCARAVRFSGAELALRMWLEMVGLLGVGAPLRILSGFSTISGGLGLG